MKNLDQRWYGWRKDKPDARDFPFVPRLAAPLPRKVILPAKLLPPVLNQGALGSCTGHGLAEAVWCAIAVACPDVTPEMVSRLFIYFGERQILGTLAQDSGGQIRDGIKFLRKAGACTEKLWPYDIKKFAVKPPKPCWDNALLNQMVTGYRIKDGDIAGIKAALASGFPVVFGCLVFKAFESKEVERTGIVPMPGTKEQLIGALGGHCMMIIGYDDATGMVLVRNSWGKDWGLGGNCWLPYAYVASQLITSDLWVIQAMEGWSRARRGGAARRLKQAA